MDCKDREEQLSAYIDGELSADERADIEVHLKGCPQCSRALEELKETVAHLQGVEEVEPPAWLKQKIMANVRAEAETKQGFWTRLFSPANMKVTLPALATLAIAVTAFIVFTSIEPEIPVSSPQSTTVNEGSAERQKVPLPRAEERSAQAKRFSSEAGRMERTAPARESDGLQKDRGISGYESRWLKQPASPGRMGVPQGRPGSAAPFDFTAERDEAEYQEESMQQTVAPEQHSMLPSVEVALVYRGAAERPGRTGEGVMHSLNSLSDAPAPSENEEASFTINIIPHLVRSGSGDDVQYRVVLESGAFHYLSPVTISPEEQRLLHDELDRFVMDLSQWEQVLSEDEISRLQQGEKVIIHVDSPFAGLEKFSAERFSFSVTWDETLNQE
jgi:anti-sigma factor RsiW